MEMHPEQLTHLLGSNIRRRREELKLTQEKLAEKIGVKQGYVSDLESGKRRPLLGTLAQLADALEVPPSYLLSGSAPAAA